MAILRTTNITTTLVGNAIGSSSSKVGELCTHANINKFSRYKPIEFNKSSGLTHSDYESARWGLSVEKLTDVRNPSNKQWKYEKPSTYARRLGDFREYNHNAPIALLQTKGTTFLVNTFDGNADKTIDFAIKPSPTDEEAYCLNVSHIKPVEEIGVLLDNYYLGAAIYQGDTLKGEYFSYDKIKYSEGQDADINGYSIMLSNGSRFNSNDEPIENYPAGSYTIYLFISKYDVTIPDGMIQMYWVINHDASHPQAIATTVPVLNDIFGIELLGIRPTGGVWADLSTDFKHGTISQAVRGSYRIFHAKYRISNKTSETVYLDLDDPYTGMFLFFNHIYSWGGEVYRSWMLAGEGTISIETNSYYDLLIRLNILFPETPVDATGSLSLGLHLHRHPDDSVDQFIEDVFPKSIILEYSP